MLRKFYALSVLLLLPLISFAKETKTLPEFHARLVEDLGTLDWNYGELNPEIVYQLMEGLFRAGHDGEPELAAARSYKWNDNKTELTVELKRDRRWSDGSPVCAQQFVDSWSRLRDKKFASPYAHYANVLRSFDARSCRTLRIVFDRPTPEAPALFSHYVFFPYRKDNLDKNPDAFRVGTTLMVNGPYRVSEWRTNRDITLERNPQYQGTQGRLAKIQFLFIPDESTAKTMFEQKKIDWMKDVPPLLRNAKLEKSAAFHIYPSFTTYYFGLNASKSALLSHPEVRAALSEALERKELGKVLGKEAHGVETWLTKEIFPALTMPAHTKKNNLALAKKILQAAKKAGTMDLKLRVYEKSAHKLLAEWAQGQWEKKLGVRIPIEVQEGKVYWREIYTDPAPIFLSGVTAPYGHPRAFAQEFLSTSTANWTGWSAKEYDTAVNAEDFNKAEEILHEAGYIIPLYARGTVVLLQPQWKNFWINPLGQVFLQDVDLRVSKRR